MRLPDDPTKYSNQWKYIELARYVPKKDGVLREMVGPQLPRMVEWKDLDDYRREHNNTGIYTSVFQYNSTDLDQATRLGPLYFDLDSSEGEDARVDTLKLAECILELASPEEVRIYFTGKKGFHIEVEPLAAGITPGNNLPSVFRFIAGDLKDSLSLNTIDFAVYDLRRMWRAPNSIHQSTGLFKRLVRFEDLTKGLDHLKKLAQEPSDYVVPEQEFNPRLNEWYREYTYKMEEAKKPTYTASDLIERFQKHGSSGVKKFDNSERTFDPVTLFDNCPSIMRLWEKAETQHHLEHEERLFLLSILSYTDEALWYLHEILRNCSDYNPEKTDAHVKDWVKRRELEIGGRPFSCQRANEAGVGCGNCGLEPKKKWVKAGDSWIETDEESKPSPVRFAYSYGRKRE